MKTLLFLTASGSLLSLILLALRYRLLKKMPSTVYYYAWLLVLLRFAVPLPGLLPDADRAKTHETVVSGQTVGTEHVRPVSVNRTLISGTEAAANLSYAQERSEHVGTAARTMQVLEGTGVSKPVRSAYWRSPQFWLLIWLIGAVLSIGLTIYTYLSFLLRLRHELHKPNRTIRKVYASVPGRKPALFCSGAVHTPMMFGVFAPKIVLPERSYDEEVLLNILRHELTHYRRFDTLYKWAAGTVLSAHWFNPLSWLVRRELNRACELSCDEMLLRSMTRAEKQSYGNTLLTMAAAALPAGVVATTFATEKQNLKERLVQIMNYKKSGTRILAAGLSVVLLTGSCMAAGLQSQNESSGETPENAQERVIVSNVDEFLAAIAPDTTIHLNAGEYDLSTAADYCMEPDNPYYTWESVWDDEGRTHAELVISGADGLTIEGDGMDKTQIQAVPRYANVIAFYGCSNLSVKDLTAGHTTEPGSCAGGVVRLESCSNVSISGCGLYGCGTIGVDAASTSGLKVEGCDIYECSYEAVCLYACQDVKVGQCNIYRHGIREGQEPAAVLFSADYSDNIVINGNDVYENDSRCLFRSGYTKNAVFVSNKIHDNRFETGVFEFDQYGVVVDGCAFEENGTIDNWVMGSGARANNAEGSQLEASDLASMTFREIDPDTAVLTVPVASPAEVEPGGSIEAASVDEFLAAIGPDRTIILDGELFDLSTASDYGTIGGAYYFWEDCYDGPQLVIRNADGLSIKAKSDDPKATTLAAVPRFANVLSFLDCTDVQLTGFTAGHTTEPGSCSGGVLDFRSCCNIKTDSMRLYGCGVLGIQAWDCQTMNILNTEIYECSYGGAQFYRTDGITFSGCDIHDVPSPALSFYESGDKTWNDEVIPGLDGDYDVDADGNLQDVGYEEEEYGFTGRVEDLINPFAADPVHYHQEGTAEAEFAAAVQKAFAERDWETLADHMRFPVQIFMQDYSFPVSTREDFLAAVKDEDFMTGTFNDEYCERIASADLSEYGSCAYGETFCDNLIAFICYGSEDVPHITAISLYTPFYPGWA